MLKVFLVEDEIVMREGIKKNIDWEKEGFSFTGEASDGEEDIYLLPVWQVDLTLQQAFDLYLGPQQALLEAAPCSACHQPITKAAEASSLLCDGCDNCFHLLCTALSHLPPYNWFCRDCRATF